MPNYGGDKSIIGVDRVWDSKQNTYVLKVLMQNGIVGYLQLPTSKSLNKLYFTIRNALGFDDPKTPKLDKATRKKLRRRKKLLKELLSKNKELKERQDELYQIKRAAALLRTPENKYGVSTIGTNPISKDFLESPSDNPKGSSGPASCTQPTTNVYQLTRINKSTVRRRKLP